MNFTFLIGNGFDLNLRLKTDYQSFLHFYLAEGHDGSLTEEIKKDFDKWSDLEKQLGIYAGSVVDEDEQQFLEEKEEMDASLVRYLTKENSCELIIGEDGAQEFKNKVVGFYQYLSNSEKAHYNSCVSKINEAINYCFISFNYTDILDRIVSEARKIKVFSTHSGGGTNRQDYINIPVHIHGTLNSEMILGINDSSQIINNNKMNSGIVDYLVKPQVNNALGNQRNEQVKSIIDGSRYICVFGMSLGITDKIWWEYISEWLRKSTDNRLILFMYDSSGQTPIGSRSARMQDQYRRKYLDISGKKNNDALKSQIIVLFGMPLFAFDIIRIVNK